MVRVWVLACLLVLWLATACSNNQAAPVPELAQSAGETGVTATSEVTHTPVTFSTESTERSDVTGTPRVQPTTQSATPTTSAEREGAAATATPTPVPTAIVDPTPTWTPLPIPTATPTPPPVIFNDATALADAGRNRFTGEALPADTLDRRAFFCKISNWPPQYVRPQSGINSADIVFEHVTEGPITRFSALFYGTTPPNIGPIRSARLIDLELSVMYDAYLCFSGASIGVTERLEDPEFRFRQIRSWYPGYYRTGEPIPFEHTFYADPTLFYDRFEELEINDPPMPTSQMAFDSRPQLGGQRTRFVQIDYRDWTVVEWRWDDALGRYLRWADGAPIIDANTGEQTSAENVILLYAVHTLDESICEHQQDDKCLAGSTLVHLWDSGEMTLLRDSKRFDGVWRRDEPTDMLTFETEGGDVLPLQVGNTWVQVIPTHYTGAVSFDKTDSFDYSAD